MIPGDQGGGGWGYQVVNIDGVRGLPPCHGMCSRGIHSGKKRARMARLAVRGSQQMSEQGRSIARGIAGNGGRLRMWLRLTEVTSTLRRVPV